MKMKLSELEFIKLLPQFMRDDGAVKGLAAGMDLIIPQLSQSVKHLTTWDQIDNLTESELDDLAWELNILWYELDADIEIKREVIRNSDKVYQHLGTKWAVENVVSSYFGTGHIKEWFEYDGQPGRFRVYTSNPNVTGIKLQSFLNLLNKVKRASAKLEAVYLELEQTSDIAIGAATEMSGRIDIWPFVAREMETTGRMAYGAGTEMGGKVDIWPLVVREVETTGGVKHRAGTEMGGKVEIWPLTAREMDTSGTAARASAQTYYPMLEIYPQGGQMNG